LIVDDEPAIVDLLAFLFEDEGYEVLRAYDGEQGLRLAKRVHPDLVISDVSMPRLTGLDLLDGLRANGSRETPVILMSAVVRDVPAERCVFVPKPFDLDRMLALARTQLAAR
jgi:CheY-like chemotaxis protein